MRLIYLYDALCGWCYGFSPTIQAFVKQHADALEVEVVSGGMIVGARIGPIGEVAPYIATAYKDVERATGVPFGAGFLGGILKEGTAVFNSIPPALALSVVKAERPALALAFAGRLQTAIYADGLAPEDWAGYGPLGAEFGWEANAFVQAMQQAEAAAQAQRDFAYAQSLGVQGFPTVLLEWQGQLHLLSRGYVSLEALEGRYQRLLRA